MRVLVNKLLAAEKVLGNKILCLSMSSVRILGKQQQNSSNIRIDATHVNNDKYKVKRTPLMAAALKGHVECIEELIKGGAGLNIQKENDALIIAAENSFFDCVTALLKARAEVDTALLAHIALDILETGKHVSDNYFDKLLLHFCLLYFS